MLMHDGVHGQHKRIPRSVVPFSFLASFFLICHSLQNLAKCVMNKITLLRDSIVSDVYCQQTPT